MRRFEQTVGAAATALESPVMFDLFAVAIGLGVVTYALVRWAL